MNEITEFSHSVCEKLGYYVYLLKDPQTGDVFYIGKGSGNRIFEHLNGAIASPLVSDKLDRIRSIQQNGMQVQHVIHRHGLTEKEALEVEAALIDFVGLQDLTNMVRGHHSEYRGCMSIKEVVIQYDAPQIEISEPAILITVNRLYRRGMSDEEIYEITRGNWIVGERRNKARYALCIYNGIVRQAFEIHHWFPVMARRPEARTQGRWRFTGVVAKDLQHYVGGSVEKYIGAQNPLRYVNC
ncbi:MAG TPA: hypothetical protein PKM78_12395 [Anaerolineae bacterium]|nr:hypothetical protein [Anaerolineae bacterium]HNU03670.1 hypothetical protein [Anaerolineae bacterium]